MVGDGGLLTRLRDWLAAGPQPPLRRPRLLSAGPPAKYVLEIAAAVDASPLVMSTPETTQGAYAAAAELIDREVDAGCDLVLLAAPAAVAELATAAIAAFTGEEPVKAVGFDPRLPDREWTARVVAVRDTLRLVELAADLPGALGALADPALAGVTGALEQAVRRRTPIVLDGLPTLAAAVLLAHYAELDTGLLQIAGADARPAATAAHRALGLRPLLDLGELDDGVTAAVVLGLLRAAVLLPATPAQATAGGTTRDQDRPSEDW